MKFAPLFSLSLLLATALPLHAADTYTFHSRFYQITTDVEKGLARRIAHHMDAVHSAYRRRFAGFQGRARPLPLHVYAQRDGYAAFLAQNGIDGAGSGGMFFVRPTATALVTFIGDQARGRMFHALRHEGFHQFAWNRIGRTLPVWANEGLAEYFAEAIMVDGRLNTGLVPPDRLKRLRRYIEGDDHVPLADLLAMSGDAWSTHVRSGSGAVLYDEAWAVVHFLVHADRRYRRAFERYLDLLAAGRDAGDAFRQAFGTGDYRALEQRWIEYVRELEADPVKVAAHRLRFLAHGLRLLHKRGETPASIQQLKQKLQAIQFRIRRTIGHGLTTEQSARNDEFFQAPQPDQAGNEAKLKMTPPADESLPPGLAVTGLTLDVRLTWSTGPNGEPVSRIHYE